MTEHDISRVLVVGGGTMGRQIAATLALAGTAHVAVFDQSSLQRDDASAWLDEFIDDEEVRGRIQVVPALDGHSDVHLVIEAISEDEAAKRAVLTALLELAPRATIASNSSSLPVARLAADPARLVNLHFYVRPWERKVVELMTSGTTAPERLLALRSFMEALGFRVFTLAQPSFGLLYNRIWAAVKRESLAIVDEGIATAEEVDEIYRALEPRPTRGPFERMDAVGLDTILLIERAYAAERGTPISPALEALVDAGSLGAKTGRGFYDHRHASPERTSP